MLSHLYQYIYLTSSLFLMFFFLYTCVHCAVSDPVWNQVFSLKCIFHISIVMKALLYKNLDCVVHYLCDFWVSHVLLLWYLSSFVELHRTSTGFTKTFESNCSMLVHTKIVFMMLQLAKSVTERNQKVPDDVLYAPFIGSCLIYSKHRSAVTPDST